MLKHPGTEIDFVVHLSYFVACFDVYDREEDLGAYLNQFNPNSEADLRHLFRERLVSGKLVDQYSVDHKYAIAKTLEQALLNISTNFEHELSQATLEQSGMYLPSTWCINNSRRFFFEAYRCTYDTWKAELESEGHLLTPPSELPT